MSRLHNDIHGSTMETTPFRYATPSSVSTIIEVSGMAPLPRNFVYHSYPQLATSFNSIINPLPLLHGARKVSTLSPNFSPKQPLHVPRGLGRNRDSRFVLRKCRRPQGGISGMTARRLIGIEQIRPEVTFVQARSSRVLLSLPNSSGVGARSNNSTGVTVRSSACVPGPCATGHEANRRSQSQSHHV